MISKEIKQKLFTELEKVGNILMACSKCGINRSTYYRWKEQDSKFRSDAERARHLGRENICDIAEYELVRKCKEGDMNAIKYTLSHNSNYYKQKRTSKVLIEYRKQEPPPLIKSDVENIIRFEDFSNPG